MDEFQWFLEKLKLVMFEAKYYADTIDCKDGCYFRLVNKVKNRIVEVVNEFTYSKIPTELKDELEAIEIKDLSNFVDNLITSVILAEDLAGCTYHIDIKLDDFLQSYCDEIINLAKGNK